MLARMSRFMRAEDGAVTVDWVVLTAAVVGLAAAIVIAIHDGSESVGQGTGDWLNARQIGQ